MASFKKRTYRPNQSLNSKTCYDFLSASPYKRSVSIMKSRLSFILCLVPFLFLTNSAWALFDEFEDYCRDLRNEVEWTLVRARRCKVDADCIAIPLRCPFGCEALVNREKYTQEPSAATRYYVRCGTCKQSCKKETAPIVCEEKKCRRKDEQRDNIQKEAESASKRSPIPEKTRSAD